MLRQFGRKRTEIERGQVGRWCRWGERTSIVHPGHTQLRTGACLAIRSCLAARPSRAVVLAWVVQLRRQPSRDSERPPVLASVGRSVPSGRAAILTGSVLISSCSSSSFVQLPAVRVLRRKFPFRAERVESDERVQSVDKALPW